MSTNSDDAWVVEWFVAVKSGNRRIINECLASNDAQIDARDSNGATALHLAVQSNDFTLATFLLHRGADVNAVWSGARKTPLMLAACQENVIMVHLLLHNGAIVAMPVDDERSLIQGAENTPIFIDWLRKQKSKHVTPREKVEHALMNSWRAQK